MMPRARPKSLVVSVFPVPAGPAGAPLMVKWSDWVSVMYHLGIHLVESELQLIWNLWIFDYGYGKGGGGLLIMAHGQVE